MKYKKGQGIITEEGAFIIIKEDGKLYYAMEYVFDERAEKGKFKNHPKSFTEEEVYKKMSKGLEKKVQIAYYYCLLNAPIHGYSTKEVNFYRELIT